MNDIFTTTRKRHPVKAQSPTMCAGNVITGRCVIFQIFTLMIGIIWNILSHIGLTRIKFLRMIQ